MPAGPPVFSRYSFSLVLKRYMGSVRKPAAISISAKTSTSKLMQSGIV